MAKAKNIFIEQVDSAVRQHFGSMDEKPEEADVRTLYESIYDAFSTLPMYAPLAEERDATIDELVNEYCSQLAVKKRFGFAYQDDESHPWVDEAEEAIEGRNGWYYWERYKRYLLNTKRWAPRAVRSIEHDSRAILDLMADPMGPSSFRRLGLVVASVQSGKTANYTGLICRAADAGYRVIIVMAGVHNVLRNQTQARLEEGFTGFNIVDQQSIEAVGVGIADSSHRPIACTSREADFNKNRASALRGIQTAHTNEPWLFVIKKNSNSLKQVYEWLRDNASPDDPLLLIDDEADNASINGKYKRDRRDDEPTRINGQIRNILKYFDRKCYVGYTATPFANILIDPQIDTDKYGKDLFPSSFIYTLEESTDYFGAEKVFGDYDELRPKHLRFIDDINAVLPPKHKSDYQIRSIPPSLKEAMRAFILATAIRTLRGDGDEHSTMMVNVSPYKEPQAGVAMKIEDYLEELQNAAKAYGSLPAPDGLKASSDLRDIHETWLEEYSSSTEFDWDAVREVLRDVTKSIHVVSINTDSNQQLEYESRTEHVIAVGGYRLSRGLTLEGLVVSYYSRNAKAYDALMQMARWFGYRPGYEDLCRVWMSGRAAGWYKFVADSTADLFDDLRNMRQVKRTPSNYGLKIRQSPDSLIVTARNKLGTGTRLPAPIDLNNGFVETIAFRREDDAFEKNKLAVRNLIENIRDYRKCIDYYSEVPVDHVKKFLEDYENEDVRSPKTQRLPVLNYIEDRLIDGELRFWDVYIAQGDGPEDEIADNVSVNREIRYPGAETSTDVLVVGEKHRLASRGIEKKGLSPKQIEDAEADFTREHPDGKNTSDRYYRRRRMCPLLVIHPVTLMYSKQRRELLKNRNVLEPPANGWDSWDDAVDVFGWSISFPYTDRHTQPVEYVFNEVAMEAMRSDFEEESDDDYADE